MPACLNNLTNLEDLDLSTNSLRGTTPESLCMIAPSLNLLGLNANELTGA